MKAAPSLDTEKLAELLRQLADKKPTRKTLDALLRDHAPLLAKIFKAGWTDESLVAAFKDAGSAADGDELAFRRLLLEARRRERLAKADAPRKAPKVESSGKDATQSGGSGQAALARSESKSDDIPFNNGIK